jgi:outer membrane protein
MATSVWAAEIKIGILDIQKFQQKSAIFKKKKDAMENRFKAQRQKIDQESAALNKLETDFQKQRSVLGQEALKDKVLEIEAKRRLVKFLAEDFNEAVKAAELEAAQDVEKDLSDIIKTYAKQGAFTIIFDKRTMGLLWTEGAIDITDKIIEIYDRQAKP